MNRQVFTHQVKTLSDYPLLIGEILRRSELRYARRAKWLGFLRKATPLK